MEKMPSVAISRCARAAASLSFFEILHVAVAIAESCAFDRRTPSIMEA